MDAETLVIGELSLTGKKIGGSVPVEIKKLHLGGLCLIIILLGGRCTYSGSLYMYRIK